MESKKYITLERFRGLSTVSAFIRATGSVGANIAEDYSQFHYLNRIRFYYYSRVSLAGATEHWLDLLHERNKVMNKDDMQMIELHQKLQVKLNNFITATYKSVKK